MQQAKPLSVVKPSSEPAFDASRLRIAVVGPGELPRDVVELRSEVYGRETNMLTPADMVSENDRTGQHICVYHPTAAGEQLIATMYMGDAETSDFGKHTGLPPEALQKGFVLSRGVVAKPYRHHGLLSLMLYLAGREHRMRGRSIMYAYMNEGEPPGRKILRYQHIETLKPRVVHGPNGNTYKVVASWVHLAYAMHRSWVTLPADLQRMLCERRYLADEVEATARARLTGFFKGPWLERMYAGTLTREQYIMTLSNMHQFVRWTTRLLGRMVGITADAELRRHYIEHLEGEVDHEIMLEQDLAYLGADVDYVVNHMVPLVEIQEYMSVQESTAAFHADPVLFLAVPFAIEGLSGHIPKQFGPALARCIAGWGLADPRKATAFLSSHVHTDGGADGHWEHSLQMIRRFLTTEKQVQQFLNIVTLILNSLDRAYAAYASIPAFSYTAADREEELRVKANPAA